MPHGCRLGLPKLVYGLLWHDARATVSPKNANRVETTHNECNKVEHNEHNEAHATHCCRSLPGDKNFPPSSSRSSSRHKMLHATSNKQQQHHRAASAGSCVACWLKLSVVMATIGIKSQLYIWFFFSFFCCCFCCCSRQTFLSSSVVVVIVVVFIEYS